MGRAEAFLRAAGFDGSELIDMLELMDATIGRENVLFLPMQNMPLHACAMFDGDHIVLRRGMSAEDNRYYFARELGKLVLGIDSHSGVHACYDAEMFAAHVLVPRRLLAVFRAKISSDPQRVADAFMCPLRIAKQRIEQDGEPLRIICDRDARSRLKEKYRHLVMEVSHRPVGGGVT